MENIVNLLIQLNTTKKLLLQLVLMQVIFKQQIQRETEKSKIFLLWEGFFPLEKVQVHNIIDKKYKDSKYFFKTIRVRNLSRLIDLFNFQDVAFICGIIESRFEFIHRNYNYNPSLCSLHSTLGNCIERNKSKELLHH